jgi:mRNA-degrading endonuclease RelE of RelBE toxin-antitoxin system
MELRFSGQFNRDVRGLNKITSEAVRQSILNVKSAKSVSQIQHLVKLKKYKTHFRIRISDEYRIGVIIRKRIVWFVRCGHRSTFYKGFP